MGRFAGEKLSFVVFKRGTVILDTSGQEKGVQGCVGSVRTERDDALGEGDSKRHRLDGTAEEAIVSVIMSCMESFAYQEVAENGANLLKRFSLLVVGDEHSFELIAEEAAETSDRFLEISTSDRLPEALVTDTFDESDSRKTTALSLGISTHQESTEPASNRLLDDMAQPKISDQTHVMDHVFWTQRPCQFCRSIGNRVCASHRNWRLAAGDEKKSSSSKR